MIKFGRIITLNLPLKKSEKKLQGKSGKFLHR